ncbi:hypothetical protein [Stenotrophomonas hibiscicola]|uniref:hypothetical protein n=1 Tax=Stenotrophomonas hibiscicola TaxID=86189 RepID=UPI002E76B96B|nr:hypothetical protein [[Pseudomonas] hibiscicola]
MILRAFGILVGLVMIAFGLAVIGGALVGTGPCRVNCDLYMSIIRLVGQAHYNKIIGVVWIIGGAMFIVASMLIVKKKSPLRRGGRKARL